jgi:hypothetical protein
VGEKKACLVSEGEMRQLNIHAVMPRYFYKDGSEVIKSHPINEEDLEDIDKDVYEKMKELNTIIELQYYPDTPIGFYKVYHYDLQMAIDEALSSLNVA